MAGRISENMVSRSFSLGDRAARELIFDVIGTDDEDEVESLVLAEAPAVYGGLVRKSIDPDNQGGGYWKVRVRYEGFENENEYTFDTGGGTAKVSLSYETLGVYAAPGYIAPDFQGAINVTDDKVEGTEVPSPKYEFTETKRFDDSFVTWDYRRKLFLLTGCYNIATFRNMEPGECMFMGASGSKRGDEKWSITFRFAGSPNVTDLQVGPITGISKRGWDYLWFRFVDVHEPYAHAVPKRPVAAYVERVSLPGNFDDLALGA